MNDDQKIQQGDSNTPEWLQKLQQESWQAEILISGGAFIGLIELLNNTDLLIYFLKYATKLSKELAGVIGGGFGLVILFLMEGFLLHLILRGYWIGLIGMNFVFPKGINFEKLRFQGRFRNLIKSASNTPYLIKLDKLCSLVFAFSFFVIFSFAGFMIFIILGGTRNSIFIADLPRFIKIPIQFIFYIFLLFGLIVLIDFFTFGRLKRIKWLAKFYFPIHYFMSRITLSLLYRRLYYTIISNVKPWYLLLGLVIQIFSSALLEAGVSSLSKDISPVNASGEFEFLNLKEDVVPGKSMQFSITHIPRLEDALLEEWKKAKKDTTIKSFENIKSKEKLRLIGSVYEIYIDTIQIKNLQWMVQQKKVLGFPISTLVSIIDVSEWPAGSHQLIVRIRLKHEEYIVDHSNPELHYYAKAYFFIDR